MVSPLDSAKWRPISEAPIQPFDAKNWFMRHSDYLLLWVAYGCVIGSYGYTQKGKGRWQGPHGTIKPTHWMPLPGKPE